MIRPTLATLLVLLIASVSSAQVFNEKFDHWPVDLKINGKVIVAGELDDPSVIGQFLRENDRKQPATLILDSKLPAADAEGLKESFKDFDELELTTSDELQAIKTALEKKGVVVCSRTAPLDAAQKEAIAAAAPAFRKFVNDGGILIALGSTAEVVSEFYVEGTDARPPENKGLNLVPDTVIETNYDDVIDRDRLLTVLAAHRRCVGIGLEKNTALLLTGRKMMVAGTGQATFVLMANEREPLRVRSIRSSNGRRTRNPESVLVDLTQWRRDAIDRTLPVFPAKNPRQPIVENGTLIIIGGGGTPRGLMSRMVELAGGKDEARMVYVPCAEQDDVGERQRTVESWKRMGIKHATFIHTKDRNKANTDEEFLAPLKDATGIFFGGGRQWNFADSYYGTKAHKLMKDVLKRGGVIAGSSAGASIQGRYLARATPISNFKIMAFGYERGGLGFLDGVAIDQHFSQRGRHKDMTQLVNKYPQMLGIGLDETTAIVVQKSKAEVVGRGRVHFYDRNQPVYPGKPDYIALPAGSEFDLVERTVLKDASEKDDSAATEDSDDGQ